jgi:hypothetical protein
LTVAVLLLSRSVVAFSTWPGSSCIYLVMGPDGEHGTENGAYIHGLGWVYIYLQSHSLIPKTLPPRCRVTWPPMSYAGGFPPHIIIQDTPPLPPSEALPAGPMCWPPPNIAPDIPTTFPTSCFPPHISFEATLKQVFIRPGHALHAPAYRLSLAAKDPCSAQYTHARPPSPRQNIYSRVDVHTHIHTNQPPRPTASLPRHVMSCHVLP